MRLLAVLLLLCAAVMFGVGIADGLAPFLLFGLITGAGGLTLWDRGSRPPLPPAPVPPELELRIQRLEDQLRAARDELATMTTEVARLGEERDFLRELYPPPRRDAERGVE